MARHAAMAARCALAALLGCVAASIVTWALFAAQPGQSVGSAARLAAPLGVLLVVMLVFALPARLLWLTASGVTALAVAALTWSR